MILVVDDHPPTCQALIRLLSLSGHSASAVYSGREALLFMETTLPTCVILDQMMPDMGGIDLLRLMRKNPRFATVAVIFFTAVNNEDVRHEALALGATGWIMKGSRWEEIHELVEKICGSAAT